MNDEQMRSLLDAAYRDREIPPAKVQTGVASVMGQVPRTRQRSRWWPVPVRYRQSQSPTTTNATTFQPSPIPATDGHTPTDIGRTQTMFSPGKAVTAAALVFGIGSVLLIAQPFGEQTNAPGAATEASPQPPVEYSSVWCLGPYLTDRANAWRNAVSMSDPRLQGDAYQTYETHSYPGIYLISSTLSIVNEDGAWVSRQYRSSGTPAGDTDTGVVFIGEGAYEGLIAFTWPEDAPEVPRPEAIPAEYGPCNERHGVIIDGAVAEPYSPE